MKLQRNNRQNALATDSADGKLKRLYVHRAVKMKQPHAMTGPCLFAVWREGPETEIAGPPRFCGRDSAAPPWRAENVTFFHRNILMFLKFSIKSNVFGVTPIDGKEI